MRIERVQYESAAEWRALRRQSIGASEIAAVLGISQYQDPMSVYLSKVEGAEIEQTEAMEWGTRIEDYIRQKYAEKHLLKVVQPKSIFRIRGIPMHACPDGIIWPKIATDDVKKGLECKNVGWRMARNWEHGVPADYQLQCQQSMHVLEIMQWDVAVLIGGQEYREYTIDYDAELGATLEEAATVFWDRFVSQKIPPMDLAGLSSMGEYIRKCLSKTDGNIREGTEAERGWLEDFVRARKGAKAVSEQMEEAGNNMRLVIGESDGIRWGDKSKVTFKKQKGRATVDWETIARSHPGLTAEMIENHTSVADDFRVLRVSGPVAKKEDEDE